MVSTFSELQIQAHGPVRMEKFMGTTGQLIWCRVTSSAFLFTILVELIFSIKPFSRQAGLLTATQIDHWVLSLAHLLTKFLVPDTSPCLISSSFHIKPIFHVRLSCLLQKWLLCLICRTWHLIIHSKNGKFVPYNLVSTFPVPMKNATNWYWCCFPPRLARTSEIFSTFGTWGSCWTLTGVGK